MLRAFQMRKRIRGLLMASLAALAVGGLTAPVQAAPILFNANGDGAGFTNILSLNFGSGNALSVSAVSGGGILTPGQTFQLYYQTTLVAENTANGPNTPTGLNGGLVTTGTSFQVTEVASITEQVSPLSTSSAAILQLAPVQAPGSGIAIYEQNLNTTANPGAVASNNATGAGFALGTVILTAGLISDASNYTDLTKTNPGSFPTQALNQSGAGNYAGVTTDQGTGSTTIVGNVTFTNSAYFQTAPTILATSFSSNLVLPYKDIAPSTSFASISVGTGTVTVGSPITPNVGANNGTSGPDFLQEVSGATQAFVVPEPTSITMAVTGIGVTFFAAFRAHRRRRSGSAIA